MMDCHQIWRLVPNKIKRYPGGRELDRFRGIDPPTDDGCPEAWVGSDTLSRYRDEKTDPYQGYAECILPSGERMLLHDALAKDLKGVLGERHLAISGPCVGVLVKLLDAQKQLNLQAHPSRSYAKAVYGSSFGKEESWLVLGLRDDTLEPPYILMGFRDQDAREKFSRGFDENNAALMEDCCHKIAVHPGDVFFISAGLPHAIGPGCFLLEVQEPSDITVIPFKPYHQTLPPAELAVYKEQTLGCFDFTARTPQDNAAYCGVTPRVMRQGAWGREELMIGPEQTQHFSFSRLTAHASTELTPTGFPQIALVLSGSAELRCGEQTLTVHQADELFFPASISPVSLCPREETILVLCNPAGAL